MTSPPDDTTTDTSAIIAALRAERDAAVARGAKRDSDYAERAAHQGATVEVLQAMAVSPGDPKPVFEVIVRRARDLCDGYGVSLAQVVDGSLVLQAYIVADEALGKRHEADFPRPVAADTIFGRAILAREPVQIPDVAVDETFALRESTLRGAVRALVAVPLMRDGEAIGAIDIARRQAGEFSPAQIELLQVLANQAVIAINSAEMYRALQTRTSDLQETLEYQTATSDVLKVISRSTFDLQPVLDTVAETAAKLCDAEQAAIYQREGGLSRLVANCGFPAEYEAHVRGLGAVPLDRYPQQPTVTLRTLIEGRPVHIHDVAAVPDYPDGPVRLGKQRTTLGVPLLREGQPIGVILLARQRVEPFTDRQIELVSTFADQAVIAIENTRLITEQREALEQQIATAEVLQVINASPGNLAPVFDAMLERALRLCGAVFGMLGIYDGARVRWEAFRGNSGSTFRTNIAAVEPGSALERVAKGERLVHIPDLIDTDEYRNGIPTRVHFVERAGARAGLWVALHKDDAVLGVILIYRQEARAFSDKEVALLQNFAAQAVIAIENTRLITEQREALEQQTATAEVLQVINSSPGDLAPVFDAMLEKGVRLCDAQFGFLHTYDGEFFRAAAMRGVAPALANVNREPMRPGPGGAFGRLTNGEDIVHISDITSTASYQSNPLRQAFADQGGARTALWVALRKDGTLLGTFVIFRQEVRPFSDKQIALLKNFAAQAVIAMENARLLTELQQRTQELARRNSEYGERIEQQSATIDVLEAMSASSGDAQPVFQVIVERARAFCNADNANLALVDGDMLHIQATTIIENAIYMAQFPRPVDATSMFGRAILAGDAVQTPDLSADPQHFQRTMPGGGMPRPLGLVAVPLLRAGAPVGAIVLARNTPGKFSATQVELLWTFAEQAVIAMGSAETFKELQRRTADLTRSVAELQALEEVMRAVNSSLELETVLSTIISRAVQLSDADEGTIYEYDVSEQVFVPKSAFGMSAERVAALRERRIKLGQTHLGRSAILRAPVYVDDVQQDPSAPNAGDVLPGIHAVLAVPLLRNDTVIGGLVIRRRTEKGFAETIIRLMQTFSSQAVLAIENARLFQEAGRARTAAETALRELRTAQANLIQAEKMASLGQVTAGIAHEIKNPLNFVNNFAALSVDLLSELKETAAPGFAVLSEKQRAEVDDVSAMLTSNLEKITEHGKRADGIVRAMLEHSRGTSGERRMVDLNALIDEALNLAYHGARAQDQSFNITLERDFGEGNAPIEVNPQDITRVFLNIFSNGFYAATRRAREGGEAGFVPTLKVTTIDAGEAVEIRVRDNGIGIPADIRDKLFQPFFTTKPTGEGTGLGLSITYDIVTQQHGGSIAVDSKIGDYSEFTIQLPRHRP